MEVDLMPMSGTMTERPACSRTAGATGPAPGRVPNALPRPQVSAGDQADDGALPSRALALVLVASFMVVLDFSIVNVALPAIRDALGFGAGSVQWVVTAYAITFGGLLVLGGRAADLLGRRRMFIIGLLAFAGASLAAGLTNDAVLLVVARGVQGVGAAVVAPASLSLITAGYVEGPARTRALGLYGPARCSGACSLSTLAGDRSSW
jgi:MFS family permease